MGLLLRWNFSPPMTLPRSSLPRRKQAGRRYHCLGSRPRRRRACRREGSPVPRARRPPRGLAHATRLPATTALDDCCKGSLMLRARRPPHAHPRWLAAAIRPGSAGRARSAAIRPGCAARARRRRRRCACVLALLAGRRALACWTPVRSPAAAIRPGLAGLAAIRPRCVARARWRRCCCACELALLAALGLCACVLTLLAALRLRARSADSLGRSRERDERGRDKGERK
jgi:hypothetical protein